MNDLTLFNDLFDDFGDDNYILPYYSLRKAVQSPKVDIIEDKDNYTLQMDLPGKTEKDIDLELNHNILTISSVNQTEKEEKSDEKKAKKDGNKYLIKERSFYKFSRSFTLPEDVDSEKISADCKDGILSVKMPRKPAASPKRIAINCA